MEHGYTSYLLIMSMIKDEVPAACAKLFRSFNSSSTTDDSAKQDSSLHPIRKIQNRNNRIIQKQKTINNTHLEVDLSTKREFMEQQLNHKWLKKEW